jgi:drug/metabolite transporter (DMT)-like permease
MKGQHSKHLFQLLLATLFISTSAPLGKFIAMPPPVIVWWRCALAMAFLYIYIRYTKIDLKIKSRKDGLTFFIGALFLGAHWITYYYALKLSNVAIGMLSLYTFPVITALLEPIFIKVKLNPIHIVLGLIVLLGIYILVPDFELGSSKVIGILFGLLSSIFYAIRILMLKQHIVHYNGIMLMFYQVFILSIVLFPVLFFMDTSNIQTQFPYIIVLALVSTVFGHTMMVQSFKYFAVSTSSIISSAQPIYGIIIAYFFLNEIPTWNTFFGGLLILSTVVIESIRSRNIVNKG